MKSTTSFVLMAMLLWTGCAIHRTDPLENQAEIYYFDRNGDGKVDLEKHQHPGIADADWELHDDDYNGRYEKKILHGFVVEESAIDTRVPTRVKIEKSP